MIAVVKEFDGCIAYHAKAAALKGATSEAVAEALSVALLMDGGRRRSPPSTGWSSDSRL